MEILLILFLFWTVPLVVAEEDQLFGAWSLICTNADNASSKFCTISQKVSTDSRGQKVVMGVSIHLPPDSPVAIIDIRIKPHAVSEAGIGFKVDRYDSFRLQMKECTKHVCLASGRLTKPILEQLESGQMVQVGFFIPGKKQITAPISLDGFHEAYMALSNP